MKLKKVTSVLLAAAMTASMVLAGCGNSSSGETKKAEDKTEAAKETEAPKADKVETEAAKTQSGDDVESAKKIILFQSKVEIIDQLEELAEAYEDETGVEVEVWGTTGDDYFQQLKTKLANNQGPTVFSLAPGAESVQMTSYLADLSDISFADKIAEGMGNEIDGKLVGIPYTAEGFGLVYNKSLYDPSTSTPVSSS